jgi:hypothetical protein
MRCPACRHENPAPAKFCLECGTRLVVSCANCRTELPPSEKFQHPALGLVLEMPAGWKTKNTPAAAIATEPNGRAAVALQPAAEGDDPLNGARADGLVKSRWANSREESSQVSPQSS